MSTTEIILSIISSSVLSAILTSYFNWKIHDSNYKKDYYKKLLDRRLEAYENLNTLTNKMSVKIPIEHDIIHGILSGPIGFNDFNDCLLEVQRKSFWLDDITSHKLSELAAFMYNNVSCLVDDSLTEDEQHEIFIPIAIKHFQQIDSYKDTFRYFLNNELKNLYKIDDFFDDNRVGQKKYILNDKQY